MQREPRPSRGQGLRPVNAQPAKQGGKYALPALLIGGSVIAVLCAAAFAVYFIFFFDPAVPDNQSGQPTPGGEVVRYNDEQSGQSGVVATPQPVAATEEPQQPAQSGDNPEPSPTPVPAEPTAAPEQQDAETAGQEADEEEPEEEPTKAPPKPSASASDGFAIGMQVDPSAPRKEVIQHLNELGVTWVKFQLSWKDTEPEQGVRNWGEWDKTVLAYHNAGFKILMSVPKSPDWARPAGTDFSQEGPPSDPEYYGNFVGEMAQRYKGGIQAVEVWNEQNLAREGGGAPMPPADYVALLSNAYQYIKAADSGILVISGAPTPAGDVPGQAIDDINYLNAMYAAGLKQWSDGIGVHPSGYNCPADGDWQTITDPSAAFRGPYDNRHHSWCFRGTMEGYRGVMEANGDSGKNLWVTEFGWAVSSNPQPGYEYATDNTREEQAQWILSAYQQAQGWGWAGPMFLWNLNYDVTSPGSEEAAFSILTASGPTPAYQALAGWGK